MVSMIPRKLAERVGQLKAQEECIQRLIQQRFLNDQELIKSSEKELKGGEYLLYKQFGEDSYMVFLSKEDEKQQTVKEIDVARENLIAVMKERKILERLKEKKFKSVLSQAEKLGQAINDEMITMRYPSKRKVNQS